VKERAKGSWADEWVLTPAQQREVLESRDEREEERRKRMLYRVCLHDTAKIGMLIR